MNLARPFMEITHNHPFLHSMFLGVQLKPDVLESIYTEQQDFWLPNGLSHVKLCSFVFCNPFVWFLSLSTWFLFPLA